IKSADARQMTEAENQAVRERVEAMLLDIEKRRERAVMDYARDLDGWEGDFLMPPEKRATLIDRVPAQLREDIRFAYDQVVRFATAQRESLKEFEIETEPG